MPERGLYSCNKENFNAGSNSTDLGPDPVPDPGPEPGPDLEPIPEFLFLFFSSSVSTSVSCTGAEGNIGVRNIWSRTGLAAVSE